MYSILFLFFLETLVLYISCLFLISGTFITLMLLESCDPYINLVATSVKALMVPWCEHVRVIR